VLDIKWIRENRDAFVKGLKDRGLEPSPREVLNQILKLDEQRRATIQKLQEAQARRNAASKEIGNAKATKNETAAERLMEEVARLKTESAMPCHKLMQGMNALLPDDIVIKEAVDMPDWFDPRNDSKGKIYLYRIINRNHPSAIARNFTWHIFAPLDIAAMREAAKHFIGEKDFSSFKAANAEALHFTREVTSVEVFDRGEGLIEIEVRGTAFLRHMVRIMTGTLVAVGKGKISPAEMPAIIEAKDRTAASMTAPSQGLILVKVEY